MRSSPIAIKPMRRSAGPAFARSAARCGGPGRVGLALIPCLVLVVLCAGCKSETVHARRDKDPAHVRQASYPEAYARDDDLHAQLVARKIRDTENQIKALRARVRKYRAKANAAQRDPLLSPGQKKSTSAFYSGKAGQAQRQIAKLRTAVGALHSAIREHKSRASEHRRRAHILRDGGIPEGAGDRP